MIKKLNPAVTRFYKAHKSIYKKIYKTIESFDRIVIYRHIRPDFDAMGSQMGLYTFLKENFPNKEIHFVGDNHVKFTPTLFPETEKLSEEWHAGRNYLAIVCDVGVHPRIADPRYQNAKAIIKIDHHPADVDIANGLSILDVDAASASELAADLCLNWKHKFISQTAAKYWYIGIVGDSGRFLYSSTSQHTFGVAEELLKTGININDIYHEMYEKDLHALQVQAYILSHYNVSAHGVAYYVLPLDVQNNLGITTELGKENINMFSNIKEVNAWCSITQDADPKEPCWRVSIRSKGKDISGVATKWNGGGHAQASGAKIKDLSELDAFIHDLDSLFA